MEGADVFKFEPVFGCGKQAEVSHKKLRSICEGGPRRNWIETGQRLNLKKLFPGAGFSKSGFFSIFRIADGDIFGEIVPIREKFCYDWLTK